MDILEIGGKLVKERFGLDMDLANIGEALNGLLAGAGGKIDIQELISSFMGAGGLKDIIGSWLGDGANAAISPSQITQVLGDDKISSFASQLGLDKGLATEGLADIMPKLIDKISSGGSLLGEVADFGGVFDMAKKLF